MQIANYITNFSKSILRDTQAQVWTMGISLIVLVHLNENISRVIVQRHWIILIKINTYDISVPADASAMVPRHKYSLRLLRALLKRIPTARC